MENDSKPSRWERVKRFHNSRVLTTLIQATKEELVRDFDYNFAEGKKVSDFVGMIIRWSFAIFASLYLYKKSMSFGGTYGIVQAICGTFWLILTIMLTTRIFVVAVLFQASDIRYHEGKWKKRSIVAGWIFCAGVLMYGTGQIVADIAYSSALLK